MTIRDELQLDIDNALNEVAKMGSSLDQVGLDFRSSILEALGAAVDVPPVQLTVETDATGVTQEIDTAIQNVDTTSLETEVSDAIASAGADTTVEVNVAVDTAQAQEELSGLGQQTNDTSAGFDGLDKAIASFTGSASGAAGAGLSLTDVIGKIPTEAVPAAAAIAALAVVTDQFFQGAVQMESATLRMNNALGDMTSQVENVNIGGFNTSLFGLTSQVGSGTMALRNAIGTFGQVGIASGASSEKIAGASEQITVLATRAVALNPQLGSVGDVADRMQTALARGGRFAGQFGIALTSAEIKARAMQDTGKKTASELTQFDKSAAGAALATEKLGDKLKTDIEAGSKNPIIQLNKLKLAVGAARDEAGKPLVAPIIDILKTANGPAVTLTRTLGALAAAFVPLLAAIVGIVAPIAGGFGGALTGIITILTPLSQVIGGVVSALGNFAPVLGVAIVAFLNFTNVLNTNPLILVASAIGAAQAAFGGFAPAIVAAGAAVLAFFNVINVNPLFLLVTAILLAVNAYKNMGKEQETATVNAEQLRSAIFGQAKTIDETTEKLNGLTSATNDYAITQGELGKNANALSAIKAAGIDLKTLNTELNNGSKGFETLVSRMVAAGKVKIKVDGVEQTSAQIDGMNGNLLNLLVSEKAQVTQGDDIVRSLQYQNFAYTQAAQAQLAQLVISGQLTDAEVKQATAASLASNGLGSYTDVLQRATALHKQHAAEATNSAEAQQKLANGLADLGGKALTTKISEDELKAKSEELGVSMDDLKKFTDGVKQAFDQFRSSLLSNLPDVQKVITDLGNNLDAATNPDKIIENLKKQGEALINFQANLKFLIDSNFTDLARVAAQRGPEFTNAIVNTIKVGRPGLAAELNHNIHVYQQNVQETTDYLNGPAANALFDANAAVAQQGTAAFGQNFNMSGIVPGQVEGTRVAIVNGQPTLVTAAGTAGQQTTDAFGNKVDLPGQVTASGAAAVGTLNQLGLAGSPILQAAGSSGGNVGYAFMQGIATVFDTFAKTGDRNFLGRSAADLVSMIERVVREKSGTKSPSRMFMKIGEDLVGGLQEGWVNSQGELLQAVGGTVDSLGSAVNSQTASLSFSAPGQGIGQLGGITWTGDVNVTVPPGVKDPEAWGKLAAEPIASKVQSTLSAVRNS